jgi:hypothetical protein
VRQFLLKNNFFLIIVASIFALSGCEKKYDLIIDSIASAPFFTNAVLSPDSVKTDNLPAGQPHKFDDLLSIRVVARVSCASGINNAGSVRYNLTGDQVSSNLSEGSFKDDGIPPDSKKGDSVFTGYVDFQINRVVIGNLDLKLWSENTDGSLSNVITLPLKIYRTNHKPNISNLELPDTLISSQGGFKIKVKVVDPDGQDDIRTVYRVTKLGNMYKLNGSRGDSIFTETFNSIPPAGTYLYRFFALDQSFDSSSVLIDSIVSK